MLASRMPSQEEKGETQNPARRHLICSYAKKEREEGQAVTLNPGQMARGNRRTFYVKRAGGGKKQALREPAVTYLGKGKTITSERMWRGVETPPKRPQGDAARRAAQGAF